MNGFTRMQNSRINRNSAVLSDFEWILNNFNASDWPLWSRALQICLWFATKLNADKIL